MKRLKFVSAVGTALVSLSPASAEQLHLKVIATRCVPVTDMRVAPGADAAAAGENYSPLNATNAAVMIDLAKKIFVSSTPDIAEVPAIYFYGTTADGEQWKKEGNWPTQAVRAQTGDCSLAPPQSMGRKKAIDYALLEVTCPSGHEPWTTVRLGAEIAGGKVTSFCANIGDYGSLVAPKPEHHAQP